MTIDLTIPLSILIFVLGVLAALWLMLPRYHIAQKLKDELKVLGGQLHDQRTLFAMFKGNEYQTLQREHDELKKTVSKVENSVGLRQLGR